MTTGLRLALGVRRKGLSGASGLVTTGLREVSSCSFLFGDAKGERKEDRKERGDFEGRTMAMILSQTDRKLCDHKLENVLAWKQETWRSLLS